MRKILLLTLFNLCFVQFSSAQCDETAEDKILLLGDSWAFFMHVDGTLNTIEEKWGHSNYSYYSSPTLSVNGARTEDFLTPTKMTEIENTLIANPQFKAVHLSIGGNDVLGSWTVDFTTEQSDSLKSKVYDRIVSIIDFIHGVRPEIQVIWSGYMYPNFEEVIAEFAPLETSHPFYGNWEGMGFPSFEELNTILSDFSNDLEVLVAGDPLISFVSAPALMQKYYGQELPLEVAPFGTYSAGFQPLPAGDITYPSPKVSMRDYGLARDCFHLSAEGFEIMMDYQFQKIYHKLLMDDLYLFPEGDSKSGTIFNDSTGSVFSVGDEGVGKQVTLLSFNTDLIADTVIDQASIFLRRKNLSGVRPFTSMVNVRFKNGYFGTSEAIELEDKDEAGDLSSDLCVFGKNDTEGDWLRIDLDPEMIAMISNTENFQIIIEANAAGEDNIIEFSDLVDEEFAPVLNLKYKGINLSILENEATQEINRIQVFPNPTRGVLYFNSHGAEVKSISILNLAGQLIMREKTNLHSIDLLAIPPGAYFFKVETDNGVFVEQFVKQ